MIDFTAYLWAAAALASFAAATWLVSLAKNDVSIVDAVWSILFLIAATSYAWTTAAVGPRMPLIFVLVTVWALRLSLHIAWRNHGKPEDYRYQQIRTNNEPGFRFKSLYLVFGLQSLLAWVIATPLAAAISGETPVGVFDYLGIGLWLVGFFFEAVGDWQLTRFRRDPASRGKVLNTGLWAYTRHPNYFGDCMVWWGFYLIAVGAGGWWTVFAPVLMTLLLVNVSGVALLEKDISARRPEYADYIRRTNAFFPGPRRAPGSGDLPC
jgi:steroid 5-alpha reductase family enzyme